MTVWPISLQYIYIYNLWRRHNILISTIQQLHEQHSYSHTTDNRCQPWTAPSARTAPSPWSGSGWFGSTDFCKGHDLETINTLWKINMIHHDTLKTWRFGRWFSFSKSDFQVPNCYMLVFDIGMSQNWGHPEKKENFQIHPGKLTCPLKMDYFNRKYIFQPSFFRGYISFQGYILFLSLISAHIIQWPNFHTRAASPGLGSNQSDKTYDLEEMG